MPNIVVLVTIAAALAYNFMNGFHDTANAIATSVLTRALSISQAIIYAAGLNFLGALVSAKVAMTIGKGIVAPGTTNEVVVLAALLGGMIWLLITWYLGLPTSSSHTLIGGIVGAVIADHTTNMAAPGQFGFVSQYGTLNPAGLERILIALFASPVIGVIAGTLFMVLLLHIFGHIAPTKLNRHFKRLQVVSAGFMAFSHGSNDAQQVMGVIALSLFTSGFYTGDFYIPLWVKIASAIAMGLGTAFGGWRIIKTIGRNVVELKPIHGFAAETASAGVIQIATHLGLPVSTTHVIASAIMGVGLSRRVSAVKWGVVTQILGAWVMTIPVSMVFGALAYWILRHFI